MTERVECDTCGFKVNVRKDNTIAEHHYGPKWNRTRCEASETQYSRHTGTFFCVGPITNRMWVAECRCGETWTGPAKEHTDYYAVEKQWSDHCEQIKAGQAEAVTTA